MELALGLPLLAVLALALVQVAFVVRDQVLLTHAAREAAREAAVSPATDEIRAAALDGTRLDAERLELDVHGRGRPGSRVRAVLRYSSPTAVPLVGALVGDVRLTASVSMRVEI